MKVERITLTQQRAVNDLRSRGRTDRQIEAITGLPRGILSRRYLVDDSEERAVEVARQAKDDWFFRAPYRGEPKVQGWRPDGDCVRSRPNEKQASNRTAQ